VEHVNLVQKRLAGLKEHQLAVLIKKSEFHVWAVEFLGYIVAVDGVMMSTRKGESFTNCKPPRSVNKV